MRQHAHSRRFSRLHAAAGICIAGLAAIASTGCERGSNQADDRNAGVTAANSAARRHVPTLVFPTEIRSAQPEIGAFLDEFLNTWLSMDYLGYRRLVSRAHNPESRERFELICEATASVRVELIERVETREYPTPAYRTVFEVELTPEAAQRRREFERKIAILIFPELGEWRMAAAPAEFQPPKEISQLDNLAAPEASSSIEEPGASATPASAPSYPWDEEGDY